MEDHIISAYTKDGIWLVGTVDEYSFQAKVCDTGSDSGIGHGRVIKLHAYKSRKQKIFAYERGWSMYPANAHKDLCRAVIGFCESLPAQDIWRKTFREERWFLVTEEGILEFMDHDARNDTF